MGDNHEPIDLDDLQRVAVLVRERTGDNWLADMVEIARAEITRLRAERRWIPVTERLPERHVVVDVHARGSHPADRWTGTAYRGVTINGEEWCDTTHGLPLADATGLAIQVAFWQPLPPPPGEGEVE